MGIIIDRNNQILYYFMKYYAETECEKNYDKEGGSACSRCYQSCGSCLKDLAEEFGKINDCIDEEDYS